MDYEPDEEERQVLNVLREHGRANPMLIREETGLRKEYVSRALTGLRKAQVVRKVTRGLYDHVPENDDEFEGQTVEIPAEDAAELAQLLTELDNTLEAEYNTGSHEAEAWANRLWEAIDDG